MVTYVKREMNNYEKSFGLCPCGCGRVRRPYRQTATDDCGKPRGTTPGAAELCDHIAASIRKGAATEAMVRDVEAIKEHILALEMK